MWSGWGDDYRLKIFAAFRYFWQVSPCFNHDKFVKCETSVRCEMYRRITTHSLAVRDAYWGYQEEDKEEIALK